ncbi:hypothetical protein LCGC14_3085880, partial [marine sediment metagenome]
MRTEIKGLDTLKNLETLLLGSNKISQLKSLDNLKNLKELRLSSNNIKKIEGLESLKNLRTLSFWNNQISVIENIGHLTELESLDLRNNNIKKITGLENLLKLKKLYIQTNQGTIFIPLNLIENLGGTAYSGEANEPQKFVEFCQKIKKLLKRDSKYESIMWDDFKDIKSGFKEFKLITKFTNIY